MNQSLIKLIAQNAHTITKMREEVEQASKNQALDPNAWKKATETFQNSYDRLAFPGGLTAGLALLQKGDPSTIEIAITYLKANPYFFRSGYIKGTIARLLKQVMLSSQQVQELQNILLDTISTSGKEYREYCRLACKIATEDFRNRLQEYINQAPDKSITQKAQNMLDALPKSKL